MGQNRFLQRALTLLIAASLLWPVQASAGATCSAGETGNTDLVADLVACDVLAEGSAEALFHPAVDKLLGSIDLKLPRSHRPYLRLAFVDDARSVCSAHWLRLPARDPPKTLRFCTFLI